MGNSSTKESRVPGSSSHRLRRNDEQSTESANGPQVEPSRPTRGSRPELSFLGISAERERVRAPPEPRRETKQEREVRKLEKERVAREKERERSMKEEHVDGGYLVTQGVYTGTEDFSKVTVRQLMIERRIAPFWRGLEDFKETWTEHQLVAAARGLEIPAADAIPPEEPDHVSELPLVENHHNLAVPQVRSASYDSDHTAALASRHTIFRPRSKTLASLTSSKNASQENIVPHELQLPNDPYVNGQKMEAFLYKDATECPICFIYYPPYLNKTRCCDQAICSECFVQIKRPDPHAPEHADPSAPPPAVPTPEQAETLVSEPACCPYCQQEEFGVTYEPTPFRRGLAYTVSGSKPATLDTMTSPVGSPNQGNRRRTTSISANASTVITTDRIRPDWAIKLANARNHAARRSAAATALHTAAYLVNSGTEQRGFGLYTRSRFARNREPSSGSATPDRDVRIQQLQSALAEVRRTEPPADSRPVGRRSRIDDLDDMMMMEAIRLSLAAEEERKKKEEKAVAKEAKKKAKDEEKQKKKEKKSMYNPGASASALSLPISMGRKRGNSGSSTYLREATINSSNAAADKGKSIDRGEVNALPIPIGGTSSGVSSLSKSYDPVIAATDNKSSHLRHMSNASSPTSSFVDSPHGSLQQDHVYRNGSSSSLDTTSGNGTPHDLIPDIDTGNATPNATEPMFNFSSLAAMIDREDAQDKRRQTDLHLEYSEKSEGKERGEASGVVGGFDGTSPFRPSPLVSWTGQDKYAPFAREQHDVDNQVEVPDLMITPHTPAAMEDDGDKELGGGQFHIESNVRAFGR